MFPVVLRPGQERLVKGSSNGAKQVESLLFHTKTVNMLIYQLTKGLQSFDVGNGVLIGKDACVQNRKNLLDEDLAVVDVEVVNFVVFEDHELDELLNDVSFIGRHDDVYDYNGEPLVNWPSFSAV
jgi:hypothetical protein